MARTATCVTLSLLALCGDVLAAEGGGFAAPSALPASGGTPGVGRVLVSLALVIALLLGGAWLTRRFSGMGGRSDARLRVVASLALGARERAVLVNLDGRELLLGVAPGQVRTLLIGDAPEAAVAPVDGESPTVGRTPDVPDLRASFSDILRRSLGR